MCKEIYAYIVYIINVCSMFVSDKRYLKTWRMAGIVHVYSNFSGYDSVPWTCTHDSCMMRTWCVSYWLAMFGCEFSATIFGWSYFWFSAGELFVFQDNVLLNLRLTIKGCYVFFRDSVDLSVLFCTNLGAKIGRSASITAKPKILAKDEKTKWMEKMIIQKVQTLGNYTKPP